MHLRGLCNALDLMNIQTWGELIIWYAQYRYRRRPQGSFFSAVSSQTVEVSRGRYVRGSCWDAVWLIGLLGNRLPLKGRESHSFQANHRIFF